MTTATQIAEKSSSKTAIVENSGTGGVGLGEAVGTVMVCVLLQSLTAPLKIKS